MDYIRDRENSEKNYADIKSEEKRTKNSIFRE